MLNTIGMSESIMKLIERRNKMDMLIFLALAIGTLVLIYALFVYVKPFLFGYTSSTELAQNIIDFQGPIPSLEPAPIPNFDYDDMPAARAVSYESI